MRLSTLNCRPARLTHSLIDLPIDRLLGGLVDWQFDAISVCVSVSECE